MTNGDDDDDDGRERERRSCRKREESAGMKLQFCGLEMEFFNLPQRFIASQLPLSVSA
jgi:hypothetical protein